MNDYWAKRVLENESKAQRYAAIAVKRQEKLYRSTYKQISKQIDNLVLELLEKGKYGSLSRSELWQYKKYIDLQNSIGSMFLDMSEQQISITTDALRKCFEQTIESLQLAENIILNKTQVDQVLNTAWSGKHYSQRIYGTNTKIAERVKKDITDLVIQGKNTKLIKKQLMSDMDVSYSYADRLVRTEASHVFNEAAKKSYEQAHVKEVKVLVEDDANLCKECQSHGGIYTLGTEPMLPLHPNCRCCYAPVVNLSKAQGQNLATATFIYH